MRAVLVARLWDKCAAGELSSADVRAAAAFGISERTAWRWLSEDAPD